MTVEQIAKICHDANRSLCETLGDYSQRSWEGAEYWQQESAIKGVEFALSNPNADPAAQHEAWMRDKIADGWVFGEVKDAEAKTHPCLVEYDELPPEQRAKDYLFLGIVRMLAQFLPESSA